MTRLVHVGQNSGQIRNRLKVYILRVFFLSMLQGWLPDVAGPSSILSFDVVNRFDQMIVSTSVHQRKMQLKVESIKAHELRCLTYKLELALYSGENLFTLLDYRQQLSVSFKNWVW